MGDEGAQRALLIFAVSLLIGPIVGALIARRKTLYWGVGISTLLVGSVGLHGAATVGWQRYQALLGTAFVQGRLLEFAEERIQAQRGRVLRTVSPVVEYVASDGQARLIRGLGGGLAGKSPGDIIGVRYSTTDPTQARIANFHNMWGVVWVLGLFGGFPALVGLFFTWLAIADAQACNRDTARSRRPTPVQLRWRTRGTILANLVLASGFLVLSFYPGENVAQALGAGFATFGLGASLHFVTQSLPPMTEFEDRGPMGLLGAMFIAFGFGVWMIAS